jgi:hypothetical protein
MGLDARRVRYFDLESFAPVFNSDDFGDFIFQGTFTGNAFGDFLEGTPTSLFFAVSSPDVGGTAWQYGVFGQDEYQVNSRLTLNYGLRWQILPGFHEDGGNLANFDQRNNSIVVPDQLSAYLQQQNIQASNLAFQQSFNACNLAIYGPAMHELRYRQPGSSSAVAAQHLHAELSAALSIAWRPFNDTKTVIRAGFGIFTMTNLGPLSFNNSGNPTSALHTYTQLSVDRWRVQQQRRHRRRSADSVSQHSTTHVGVQYGGGGLDQGVDPNYRDPQANQWNLTVERQLASNDSLRVSYVGMHSYRLSITEDLNQIPASTTPYQTTAASPYVDPRAPYHNWFTLYSTFNAGEANYNALEVEETIRCRTASTSSANYTLREEPCGQSGRHSYRLRRRSQLRRPHRQPLRCPQRLRQCRRHASQSFPFDWSLPVARRRRSHFLNTGGWKNAVLGGWELTTMTLLETGPWLTPSISDSFDQSNTNVVNRGAYLRPDQVSTNFYQWAVTRALLQSRRVRAHPRRFWTLRQRRSWHSAGSRHGCGQPRPRQSLPCDGKSKNALRVHIYQRFQPYELRPSRYADRYSVDLRRPERSANGRKRWKSHRPTRPANRILGCNLFADTSRICTFMEAQISFRRSSSMIWSMRSG